MRVCCNASALENHFLPSICAAALQGSDIMSERAIGLCDCDTLSPPNCRNSCAASLTGSPSSPSPSLLSSSCCQPSSPPGGPRLGLGVSAHQEAERGTARPARVQARKNGGGGGGWRRGGGHQSQQRNHGQSRRRRGQRTERRQVASPRRCCSLTPPLLYTLSLTPLPSPTHTPHTSLSLLSPLHPTWLSSPPRCQKEKRGGNRMFKASSSNTRPPPLSPRRSSSCNLRPRNMMQKLKTKLKRETGARESSVKEKHRRKLEKKEKKSRFTLQK